jgi:predicted dehydrogenase
MSKIKFGVWGFGRVGVSHSRHFTLNQNMYEMVAACDIDEEKLNNAKSTYQCATYTDPKKFLKDENMELVMITTLSLDHTNHAMQALKAGKYVLLDKPIAITDEELETLRKADKDFPGKLFVFHNLRFEPEFETVQRILQRNILGEISMIKLRRHHQSWYFRSDWQTRLEFGGGLLNNWGNHDIDHAMQLLESPAVNIWSKLWHVTSAGDGDDHVKIIINGNNSRVVDLEISNNVVLPDAYCTIYGQRGTLICTNNPTREVEIKYLDPDYQLPELYAQKDAKQDLASKAEIPWVEETVKVESEETPWKYIDVKFANYLYKTLRENAPFPIKNSDAFETIRIIQEVKKQNPEFNWIK